MSRRLVLTTAALLTLASLAWFLWPQQTTGEVASGRAAPTGPRQEAALQPPRAAAIGAGNERVELDQPPATQDSTKASMARRVWVVRGRVDAAPTGRERETRLSAHFLGPYNIPDGASGTVEPDGTYELDLTAAVESWLRHTSPTELVVTADHPACLLAEARVPFPSGVPDRGDPQVERTVFSCDFTLESAAVVTGRVAVPPDWNPPQDRGSIERPQVGLFELDAGVPKGESGLDHATCDEEGRWRLRAARGGSFTVVALGEGLRPAARPVELVLGRTIELEPLELTRGAWISGRVGRAGRSVGAGARVGARAKDARGANLVFPPRSSGWTHLVWVDGAPERSDLTATTLGDGSYRIEGLAELDYEVWIASLPQLHVAMGGRQRPERVVRAPADGVDLEGVPASIQLTLRVDGRTPVRAELEGVIADLTPEDPSLRGVDLDLTGNDGDFGRIQVEPEVGYTLRVRPGRYASTTLVVAPLALGEVAALTLDLESAGLASTLVLHLSTDDPEPVDALQLLLRDPDDESGAREQWVFPERAEDGSFPCTDLSPGRYRIQVRPRAELASGGLSHYVATELEVVLPPDSVVEREVALELGARIRLAAKDEQGGFLRAPVELRDGRGEKIRTEFYCKVQGSSYGCGWYLCEQGLNDHPPLPAGRYQLTLTCEGFEREVRTIDLEAGETRTLEVVLRRS